VGPTHIFIYSSLFAKNKIILKDFIIENDIKNFPQQLLILDLFSYPHFFLLNYNKQINTFQSHYLKKEKFQLSIFPPSHIR